MRLGLTLPGIEQMTADRLLQLILNALTPDLRFDEMIKQVLNGNLRIDPFSRFGPPGSDEGGDSDSPGGGGGAANNPDGGAGGTGGMGRTFAGGAMASVLEPAAGNAETPRAVGPKAEHGDGGTKPSTPAPEMKPDIRTEPSPTVPAPNPSTTSGGNANAPNDDRGETSFHFIREGASLFLYSQREPAPREKRQVLWADLPSGGVELEKHFKDDNGWHAVGQLLTSNSGFVSQALSMSGANAACPASERPTEIWWYVERRGEPKRFRWDSGSAGVCSGTTDKWAAGARDPMIQVLNAFLVGVGGDLRTVDVDLSKVEIRRMEELTAIWYPRGDAPGVFRAFVGGQTVRQFDISSLEALLADGAELKVEPLLRWAAEQAVARMTVLADAKGALLAVSETASETTIVIQSSTGTIRTLALAADVSKSISRQSRALVSSPNAASLLSAFRGEMLAAVRASATPRLLALGPAGLVIQTSEKQFWGAIGDGCLAGKPVDFERFNQRLVGNIKPPTGENRLQATCPAGSGEACALAVLQRVVESPRAAVRSPDQIELGLLLPCAAVSR